MRRHRTTARGGISLLLLLGLSAGVAAASPSPAQYPGQDGPGRKGVKPHAPAASTKPAAVKRRPLGFLVVGRVQYTNDFGAPRPQGPHEGTPVSQPPAARSPVATEAGLRSSSESTPRRPAACSTCTGKSGTTYLYIHLNNDLTNPLTKPWQTRRRAASYGPGLKDGAKRYRPASCSASSATPATPTAPRHPSPFRGTPPRRGRGQSVQVLEPRLPAAVRRAPREGSSLFRRDAPYGRVDGARPRPATSATLKIDVKTLRVAGPAAS